MADAKAKAKEKEAAEEIEDEPENEDSIFKKFGIEDDNGKRRVREMAAGRALFRLHAEPKTKKKEKKEEPPDPWAE